MKKTLLTIAIAAFTTGCSAFAANDHSTVPTTTHEISTGNVLATPSGITLYTFDKDKKGVSHCTSSCAQAWPPFTADTSAQASGNFSVIKRADGTMQWSYAGKPLYTFAGDKAPGDANGNGIGGVWHVITMKAADKDTTSNAGYGSYGGNSRW